MMMAHPVHEANKSSPFGTLTRDEFYHLHHVHHHSSSFINHHNMRIFTQSWCPSSSSAAGRRPLLGLVAMVHGYSSESSWLFQLTAVAIATLGFHVFALDLRGHGFSDGRPRAHVADVRPLVDDCIQFFDAVRRTHHHLPAFLYGESLGGAIAILIALRQKKEWRGLVLNGAMCGVSPRFKPPWPLENLLPAAAAVAPRWRVAVTPSLVEKSYKEEWKKDLVRRSPTAPESERPTAATARELIRVCEDITRRCGDLEAALLVVHGGDDAVCDWESAEKVFELAGSKDKTLKVLAGAWHQLVGESSEVVELGFGIIFNWLKDKAAEFNTVSNHHHHHHHHHQSSN